MNIKETAEKLKDIFENVKKFEVDLSQPIMASLDFNKCRQNLFIQEWKSQIQKIQQLIKQFTPEEIDYRTQSQLTKQLEVLNKGINIDSSMIDEVIDLVDNIKAVEKKKIKIPLSIPTDIYSEIEVDVNELDKCFNAGCFRSCVIICGRVMEVALHRKYFDVTGNDLLEKSPGIGLGNLIAKMKEKNVDFDPGITQQIHLVNQVRIYSVHKKQQPFYPTKQQTYAMILYTMDILEKIFA